MLPISCPCVSPMFRSGRGASDKGRVRFSIESITEEDDDDDDEDMDEEELQREFEEVRCFSNNPSGWHHISQAVRVVI